MARVSRAVVVGLVALALASCTKGDASVATLAELSGVVETQRAAETAPWSPSVSGERYRLGDAVRTGGGARARLRLARGGELRLDPDTIVRFQRTPGERVDLEVEAGAIEIEAGETEVLFETAIGEARIERGGSARVSAAEGKTRLEVLVGTVILERDDGAQTLSAGQRIEVDVGGVILEPDEPVAAPDAAAVVAPAAVDAGAAPEPAPATVDVTVEGKGVTAFVDDAWAPLASGALAGGTRVRVPRGAAVSVRRGTETATVRGDAAIVVATDDGALVQADRGAVATEATDRDVVIAVPGGTIVVRARPGGSAADVAVGAAGEASVTVHRGEATVEAGDQEQALAAGETAAVTRAGAIVVEAPPPREVDVVFRGGEAPVIHDPRTPTAVGIRFDCPGVGKVEIAGRGSKKGWKKPAIVSSGKGRANVLLSPGTHRYRVVCDDDVKVSGSVTIRKDAARKELPSQPPRNVLDADGRNYTVLYQNHLPELVMRWIDAPAGQYTLHVVSGGKERTVATGAARHSFASGELREGTHRWWFAAGGKKSPETTLRIDFDNAAAAAYIRRVSRTGNGATKVEGAAVRDSTVTLAGAKVDVDQHRRFTAEARPGAGERSVALRIAHGGGSVHYYVLRTD